MKAFPAKLIMAAIILSCGFVMQAEQSEKAHQKQDGAPHRFVAGTIDRSPGTDSSRTSWR
ncbi:hypothetical protein [Geomonas ferrireducens]|jgi:hypothetical protein|uniref:hypothetical protein n=1 Tax=Geomonas ferrireducens TaxID=2570227 RepID=UPI0010A7A04E|nr:hypothetical protein [Geomonas ferrireducens]